jgi:hypothetical protein
LKKITTFWMSPFGATLRGGPDRLGGPGSFGDGFGKGLGAFASWLLGPFLGVLRRAMFVEFRQMFMVTRWIGQSLVALDWLPKNPPN